MVKSQTQNSLFLETNRESNQENGEQVLSQASPASPNSLSSRPTFSLIKTFLLMTTGGITLAALLLLVGVWRAGDRAFSLVENLFNAPPAKPEVSVSTMVVNQIQGVSELTTAVFTVQSIVPTEKDRKVGNLTLGTTRLLYMAQGEVRAGVDLSAVTANDITVNQQAESVVVKIPPAKILDSKLDLSESRVYDYDRGFLNLGPDAAPQLQSLAQQKTLDKVVNAACEQGILNQARDRAQTTIEQLLTNSGYSNVKVVSGVSSKSQCKVQ